MLDSFPISAFKISGHLENVIKTGNTDVFELTLRKVDIHALDINRLLTVTIRNGKFKCLFLDILQRKFSQLNFKMYLENVIFLALVEMDLEVFKFLLRNVDHEKIHAKLIVEIALQNEKFDIALLFLRKVSVDLLRKEKELVNELVNAMVLMMENIYVDFDQIILSAVKD